MRSAHRITAVLVFWLGCIPASDALASRVLDDFEDGDLFAETNLGWIVLADDLFGGSSSASVAIVSPGALESKGALRITGRARKGEGPFVIASSWTSLHSRGAPCDLAGFDRIRFRVRGRATAMEVGLRRGRGATYNAMAAFPVTDSWSVVEVPLAKLVAQPPAKPGTPWDPTDVWYIGFATPPNVEGEFSIDVDDLELAGDAASPTAPPDGPVYTLLTELAPATAVRSFPWQTLATEAGGDGRIASLPDAGSLWYHYDARDDRVWFRARLEGPPPADWLGFNVAIDADRDQSNGSAWWGANSAFHWDRLITAYLFRVGDRWQGIVGVADPDAVARGEMGSIATTEVIVGVDRDEPAFFIGVPRAGIDPDLDMNVIATVGSAMAANDDVPNAGFATLSGGRVSPR